MSSYYVLKIQYVNRPPETRNISAPVTTIGRESGDIVLNDPQTSGRHAEIHFQNGAVRCRDVGSTNGTWFNGQRLTEFVLEAGQWFQCGQTTLQLMSVHGAEAAGPAKTMMAMGAPPPGGGPGAGAPGWSPPGQPPAAAPPAQAAPPAGPPMGAPPPGSAPMGGPPPGGPMGAPPPGSAPMGGPPPGGPMGAPPPGSAPMGGPPPGGPMGGPPPGGPMGAPPPGSAPMGGPPPGGPMGGPPPGGPMGGPPPGGPPPGGPPPGGPMGGPMGGPPPGGPMGAPPPGGPMGGPGAPGAPGGLAAPGAGPMAPGGPGGAPALGGGMLGGGVRPNFQGSGGELFVTFLVGYLLTAITFGIYMPWFYCKLGNYVMSNTTLGPTRRGELRLEFTGQGGELFVIGLVGYLLTAITFGIYMPWLLVKLIKFFCANTVATAPDGTRFRLEFNGTGGELFVTVLVGMLLTAITFYIYAPWFICKLNKVLYSRTQIIENEQPVGNFDFEGQGGELFVTFLVGMLLTVITFYIYFPWFQVKMFKFMAENTRVMYQGRMFGGQFHGTGGEFFVTFLVGALLSAITLYIYMPWFMVKLWKFQFNNHEFTEVGAAPSQPAMPGGPGAGPGLGAPMGQPALGAPGGAPMGAPGMQPGMAPGAPGAPGGFPGQPGAPGGYPGQPGQPPGGYPGGMQ